MRIKKFIGATLKEAVEAMKRDLGPEAIVLHTRTIKRKGKLNPFAKETIEITGAIDDTASPGKPMYGTLPMPEKRFLQHKNAPAQELLKQAAARFMQRDYGTDEDHVEKIRPDLSLNLKRHVPVVEQERTEPGRQQNVVPLQELKKEIADVKSVLQHIQNQVKQVKVPALPAALQEAYLQLVEQDVDDWLAAELVHTVYDNLGEERSNQKRKVEQELVSRIAGLIRVHPSEGHKTKKPAVIALIGPTGVGKTTTIAKLSAVNKLLTNKDVALISADTYRIGAIEQLQTFAAIATIPMEVVYEPADLRHSLKEFWDKDVIYLDTVGRSQRNENDLVELKSFLKAAKPDEIHLVLNPAMSFKTMVDVIERFKILSPNRLLFTKLDEATTFGSVLNVVDRYHLPVSYICNGQVVPEDLQAADPDYLASLIYKGVVAYV